MAVGVSAAQKSTSSFTNDQGAGVFVSDLKYSALLFSVQGSSRAKQSNTSYEKLYCTNVGIFG